MLLQDKVRTRCIPAAQAAVDAYTRVMGADELETDAGDCIADILLLLDVRGIIQPSNVEQFLERQVRHYLHESDPDNADEEV